MQKWAGVRPSCRQRTIFLTVLLLGVGTAIVSGCSRTQTTKIIHGTVTYQGQRVYTGSVRFVPIEGTQGPATRASIIDGQYKIDARGGVPLGKHRIEVFGQSKTGRMVSGRVAGEMGQVDELVTVGAPKYSGTGSTIVVEVRSDSDGQIDIDIPAK